MFVVHSLIIAQNRSRSLGSERLRSRRQHVREEGATTTGGEAKSLVTLKCILTRLSSGIDTHTQKTCL